VDSFGVARFGRGGVGLRVVVEFFEEVELGFGDGAGVEGGNFGGGFGLADGGLGLGGEEGAVALGVGVAFRDGGGDAGGAGAGGRGDGDGRGSGGRGALAAGTMRSEAGGDLLLEVYLPFESEGFGSVFLRVLAEWVKLCGTHVW
jgi:hypothetical protein